MRFLRLSNARAGGSADGVVQVNPARTGSAVHGEQVFISGVTDAIPITAEPVLYDLNAAVAADVDAAVESDAGLVLMGFFASESDGTPAAATVEIVNGEDASAGDAVIPVELSASQSTREWFGPRGIAFPQGISIDYAAGTFDCTLLYRYEAT